VPCCNGTLVSRLFLSFPPQWRHPQQHNRTGEEEELRPRTQPQRVQRLARPPFRTWRLLRTCPRQELRRRSRHRELCHTSPHHELRHTLRRSGLPVPLARPPRPWRGMRHRPEPLRLALSDSRKSVAAMSAAAVERGSHNLARAKIWGGSPARAPHRAAAATPLPNKMPLRDKV
jgi:hypothetical protein